MKIARCIYRDAGVWGLVDDRTLQVLDGAGDFGQALALASARNRFGTQGKLKEIPVEDVRWLPPVLASTKIICAGINYADHAAEMNRQVIPHPPVFARFADSFVGHDEPVILPRVSDSFDYEAELAVVIGRAGRHIQESSAMDHVGGYTCMAENSVRDFQKHTTQVTPGKNFDRSGSLGPWIVTSDAISDPTKFTVTGRLNGEVVQQAGVHELICSVARLVAYVSTFTLLRPGDVIATGTPAGVGSSRKPPLFMKPDDVFEVAIDGIGCLRNRVQQEQRNSGE
ncbi:fumarylacetoacetate hydrolase family protein [Caballeronia sp. 15711]|uniref:fumarylacetoacetate hydrolase family protein n=1 Tax=Caballeronia sp. 15711 TaxID=3391029 RepID=UPI0039E50EAB